MRQQKIIDYLQTQAVPRTLKEIQNHVLMDKQVLVQVLTTLIKNKTLKRVTLAEIPHYYLPTTYQPTENIMKIQPIQAFKANDGTLFETENETIAHNIGLEHGPKIDEFLDYRKLDNKARGMQKSIITKWEVYKANQI